MTFDRNLKSVIEETLEQIEILMMMILNSESTKEHKPDCNCYRDWLIVGLAVGFNMFSHMGHVLCPALGLLGSLELRKLT